jgi:hypothetical protein
MVATFVWPSEVQWPPPWHISLNYDVVPPGAAAFLLEEKEKAMPFVSGFLRVKRRFDRWGRPVDPDYGIDEGIDLDGHPDQGLPERPPGFWGGERPSFPVRPGHPIAPGGRPIDPDYGVDEGVGVWPRPPVQRPPHVWPRPPGGGLPIDPGWGVGGRPERPSHGLPIWPSIPGKPDNSLPPIEGIEPPPVDPPPGTIWPPLPPEVPPGKAIALVAIAGPDGVIWRYTVITVPTPPAGGIGGAPPARPQPQPR